MSLQFFFEKFIIDASMPVKIYDANLDCVVFRGRWIDINALNSEYRENKYQVSAIRPILFSEYEELGLVVNINLKK